MIYKIEGACFSHVGNVRDNNEDNFYFDGIYLDEKNNGTKDELTTSFTNNDYKVFAVFDGMGGQANGERASFLAASTMHEYAKDHKKIKWDKFVRIANEKVCAEMASNKNRMGATVAGVQFLNDYVKISNLGDSRIYVLTGNSFGQVSEDHTEAKLNEKIIGSSNKKSRLTQYLGIREDEMIIQPFEKKISYDNLEKILICSDGITDMISDEDLESIMIDNEDALECAEKLLKTALSNGGEDNTTVMVFSILKETQEEVDERSIFERVVDFFKM